MTQIERATIEIEVTKVYIGLMQDEMQKPVPNKRAINDRIERALDAAERAYQLLNGEEVEADLKSCLEWDVAKDFHCVCELTEYEA